MASLLISRRLISRSSIRPSSTSHARWLATKPPSKNSPAKGSGSSSNPPKSQSSTPPNDPPPPPTPTNGTESTEPSTPTPSPSSLSLDFSPLPPATPSSLDTEGRTGAKSAKDSLSSIEKRRRAMSRMLLALMGLGSVAGVFYMGREWEDGERRGKDLKLAGRWERTTTRLSELTDVFSKPQWTELLPPPMPPPHQKPYTLLLSMDDLVITSTWDRATGWRTAKRPGIDYFLAYMSQFYEIVIFTTQPHYTAEPVLMQLDKYQFYITYRLYKEATRLKDGKVVKDLSYLNRDLSKVIILDTHPEHVETHPDNAIVMNPWKGDFKTGKELIGLIPFLESIAFYKTEDVRPILRAYKGKDIAVEYAKKEAEQKERFLAEWRAKGGGRNATSTLSFSSLFGGRDPLTSPSQTLTEPLTYLEQERRKAQAQYRAEQKYITENQAELDRTLQEDRERQMKEMGGGSLFGWVAGMTGMAPPGPGGAQPGGAGGEAQGGASGVSGSAANTIANASAGAGAGKEKV
ncbi:HAD-like protein [Sistotremastrum niveocremeum HHB9708]|uniref:Mitochondrial import inner membrane translocase subunit TIM50 n=2 Tax=Sistotremastraceae TaxID=3402574 RepID=A0A164NZY7_9AGAM|nr:HAD-like protein [Sistotremastrum niveocremeum HHB9708]KZT33837.1 HAD-like protein [Sistotremastrum suecicum HHB10207 ss-3]